MSITAPHINCDGRGVAWIDDTNVKVIEGWSPEEIHFQQPGLSLAQIHAALAYYYDHQAELDAEITSQEEYVRRLRAQAG